MVRRQEPVLALAKPPQAVPPQQNSTALESHDGTENAKFSESLHRLSHSSTTGSPPLTSATPSTHPNSPDSHCSLTSPIESTKHENLERLQKSPSKGKMDKRYQRNKKVVGNVSGAKNGPKKQSSLPDIVKKLTDSSVDGQNDNVENCKLLEWFTRLADNSFWKICPTLILEYLSTSDTL